MKGMRLIDADAFDKMLIEAQAECRKNGGNFRFGVLGEVRGNLALFPTADCPEIVRCKDCVFRDNRDGMCEHVQQVRNPDWYCADGERLDGEAE